MIDPATSLKLTASASELHVSALSSLLRTFQAAVRDSAQSTVAAVLLASQPPPVLAVHFATAHERGLCLQFGFNDADGNSLPELDRAAFGAFMDALASALKITPQGSLWGTPLRPLVRLASENERLQLFLEDLLRLGDAAIASGDRHVTIHDGRVEYTGA